VAAAGPTRLFVAIRPPAAVRRVLLGAGGGIVGARWQGDDQLHLTLAFAGEMGSAQADELIDALAEVESAAFAAEVSGVGHFESKGAPTALWARVPPSEPLARLQRRVERACRRAGLAPDKRGYKPHVTLARLPRSAGPIGGWLAEHGTLRAGPWPVEGFTLYESHLRPEGALYRPLVDYAF
jgi:2'-5' RNA ligase